LSASLHRRASASSPGVAASAHSSEEANADFEMLLLPLIHRGRIGTRLIGSLAPPGMWPAKPLRLGAIKYIAPDAGAGPTSLVGLHAGTRLTVIDGGRPRSSVTARDPSHRPADAACENKRNPC
jgi:hypothetical protein